MTARDIFLFVVVFIGINIILSIFNKQNKIKRIKNSWGQLPKYEFREPYKEKYLQEAFECLKNFYKEENIIDDITWRDLDMIHVFYKLNKSYSSVGSEALYYRLRSIKSSGEDRKIFENLIDFFKKDEKTRLKVQYLFSQLNFFQKNSVLKFLNSDITTMSPNLIRHILMGLAPIVALIIEIIYPSPIWLFIFVTSISVNMFYSMSKKSSVEYEFDKINYLINVIKTCNKIKKLNLPLSCDFKNLLAKFDKIRFLSFTSSSDGNDIFFYMYYYLNMLFMLPFINYSLAISEIKNFREDLIKLWLETGDIEASISILNYQNVVNYYCKPEFIQDKKIVGKEVYHPLLESPVANDVNWEKNTLVSGSNASGKSTYVKSVAINAILSQTIYIALAEEFKLKKGNVLTSMAIKDSIIDGDSYFIAEIKSLKRIIDDINKNNNSYYFIDEILKGTNTLERIAASTSIIQHFVDTKSLAYIATHDIELTQIFSNTLDNIHFRESFNEKGDLVFDYKLYQGPSKTRNAIKLLEVINFPEDIVENANKKLEYFSENKTWI